MGLALKCLEHVTAIGCGLAALSLGSLDPGLTALGVVSGAALLAQFKEHCAKHGLDEPELLSKMQMSVLREWDTVDQTQADRDAIVEADTAMRLYLPDCMLSREDLAASSISKEHYPKRAARLVADQLGKRDASFAVSANPHGEESIQRRFAMAVIEQALKVAMDDPAYSARLMLDLVVAGNAAHAVTHERLDAIKNDTTLIRELLAAVLPKAEARNITEAALLELARRVSAWVEEPADALVMLDRAIDELVLLRTTAARGTNLGNLIDDAVKRAAAFNELGRFDDGAKVLAAEFARLTEKEGEVREGKRTIAERAIDQARLQSHAPEAASWVMKKLMIENPDGVSQQTLLEEQDRWFRDGSSLGLAFDLEISVLLARSAIDSAESPSECAQAEHDLAISLRTQGERTKGDAGLKLLTMAVQFSQSALRVRAGAGTSVDLAKTQNNLANALTRLGERTANGAGLIMLEQALTTFNSALSIFTETVAPSYWAATQNNMANTLQIMGERTLGKAGAARLTEAISANRAALRVRTKTDMPDKWAGTQCNLGNALATLGQRTEGEEGLALLMQAVTAYREALTIYTEAETPSNWAMTQRKMGDALRAQGELADGEASLSMLTEAATAYHAALTIWTSVYFSHYYESTVRDLALVEGLVSARLAS